MDAGRCCEWVHIGISEKALGSKVVKHLTEELQNNYRHVYFDNYFTSVDLALDLHRSGLYSCATLRSNRKGFPLELKEPAAKGLKERGDSKTFQNGPLTVSVWQDSRPHLYCHQFRSHC